MSRSVYIFLRKQYFQIWKVKHTEKINRTIIHTQNPDMLQQTQKMTQWNNKKTSWDRNLCSHQVGWNQACQVKNQNWINQELDCCRENSIEQKTGQPKTRLHLKYYWRMSSKSSKKCMMESYMGNIQHGFGITKQSQKSNTTDKQDLHMATTRFLRYLDTISSNTIWMGQQKNKHVGNGTNNPNYTEWKYLSTNSLLTINMYKT